MYNDSYPIRYPGDSLYNQANNYDNYGRPPEHAPSYPMPCPELPPMTPPPMVPMPPPMPPGHEMPMPGTRMHCVMHLKHMLEKLMNKKASFIIEGAKGNFDCVKVTKVDNCTVVVETKNGVCIIPLYEITAICMSKEVAEGVITKEY